MLDISTLASRLKPEKYFFIAVSSMRKLPVFEISLVDEVSGQAKFLWISYLVAGYEAKTVSERFRRAKPMHDREMHGEVTLCC